MDHRNDRPGIFLDRPKQLLQGVVIAERVAPYVRQFLDVVSGRPDRATVRGPQNNYRDLPFSEIMERLNDIVDQLLAQCVFLGGIVETNESDIVGYFYIDKRHGQTSID